MTLHTYIQHGMLHLQLFVLQLHIQIYIYIYMLNNILKKFSFLLQKLFHIINVAVDVFCLILFLFFSSLCNAKGNSLHVQSYLAISLFWISDLNPFIKFMLNLCHSLLTVSVHVETFVFSALPAWILEKWAWKHFKDIYFFIYFSFWWDKAQCIARLVIWLPISLCLKLVLSAGDTVMSWKSLKFRCSDKEEGIDDLSSSALSAVVCAVGYFIGQ